MPGALRQLDPHVCTKIEKSTKTPHVGGPVGMPTPPANKTVLVNGRPLIVVGDAAFCVGPADKVIAGISSVKVGGKNAADSSAATDHGGSFKTCSKNVLLE
jgi:uncharacterized Zn-binding protein involved in type VI secretion